MKQFGKLLMRLLLDSRTYYVLSWIAVLGIAGAILYNAWIHFDNYPNSTKRGSQRRDGNDGHCMIDFGGQWLMGRMLYEGHGQRLYLRRQQREVAQAAFPEDDQAPDAEKSDAENLMDWLMGKDAPKGEEEPDHWQFGLSLGRRAGVVADCRGFFPTLPWVFRHDQPRSERGSDVGHFSMGLALD